MNVAVVAPSKNAVSETFIRHHIELIEHSVIYYFGGFIPTANNKDGLFCNGLNYYFNRIVQEYNKDKKYAITQALKENFKKNDIRCVYAEYGQTGVALMHICEVMNIPLIVNFHGYDISKYEVLQNYKAEYQTLAKKASALVGVSKEMCQKIIDFGADSQKVFYNPCSPNERFETLKPTFENKNILAVGRFTEKKAPHLLVLAFQLVLKEVPDAELTLIGDGKLFGVVKDLIESLKIPNINLLGSQPHDVVLKEFEKASIFVQHSVRSYDGDMEGTPVAVMEASLTGLPIVSTNHSGIKDVVIHNMTGKLVDERDIKAMATEIIFYLKNINEAIKTGGNGRAFIKKELSTVEHKKRINDVINLVCNL